jgi:pimeloyl-ACP methyl ester carboxylesterase
LRCQYRATHYTKQSGVNIAYQVLGDGPIDVIWEPPWVSNIQLYREEPGAASFLNRLASFSRLVTFDRRNTGNSDRMPKPPSFEGQVDDSRAVMDEVGATRAALVGRPRVARSASCSRRRTPSA